MISTFWSISIPTVNPCYPNPCTNSGNCVLLGNNDYQCDCPEGYGGSICEGRVSHRDLHLESAIFLYSGWAARVQVGEGVCLAHHEKTAELLQITRLDSTPPITWANLFFILALLVIGPNRKNQ